MKHIELFNYFDPIRPPEKKEIYRLFTYLLNTFLKQIGEDAVKEVKGYKCFMKYLKKFNENMIHLAQSESFCKEYLAYIIDRGFEVVVKVNIL
jgi:hypothetical protein